MTTPPPTYVPAFENITLDVTKFLPPNTATEFVIIGGERIPRFVAEFWTSKQRQASSLHEISYRACFKPQLPRFFIERFSREGDSVYDPFMGRGTTIIEAALSGRVPIGNDVNPLSKILTEPRLLPPSGIEIKKRLKEIEVNETASAEIDLSMFYHAKTESEIVSLKRFLSIKKDNEEENRFDKWIRMVATNRLTGHSAGFFSVYTLPPNQATSSESQRKINEKRNQSPPYRNVKEIIIRKTLSLLKDIPDFQRTELARISEKSKLLSADAAETKEIEDESVQLTVTSPPFLDIVNYSTDNWLRCWFNDIDHRAIAKKISTAGSLNQWKEIMQRVFRELFRITRKDGFVAFEVGEVRKRNVLLDEVVVPLGLAAGFSCIGILVNQQRFTKTSNIWGIRNNLAGTNTNRIVLFQKP